LEERLQDLELIDQEPFNPAKEEETLLAPLPGGQPLHDEIVWFEDTPSA
jgi:hypothetical protein